MAKFKEIRESIAEHAGQSDTGPFKTITSKMVNDVYRQVLDSGKVAHEHREFAFTPAVSKSQYGLPLYVRKVVNIEDPDNSSFIFQTTARAFDRTYPGGTESGDPRIAYSLGMRGVEKYPASDGTLSVVSDSTADDGANYKIRIVGFNTSGVLVTEQVTMDGTTAVNTTNSYDSTLGIERVTKAPASGLSFTGNVTVKDDDSNTIAIIPIWWDSPDYEWIEFYPGVGTSANTYTIRAEMRKPPLVNDDDWPEFDQEYHNLLVFGVTKDLLPSLGQRATAFDHGRTFKDLLKQFMGLTNSIPGPNFQSFSNVQAAGVSGGSPGRALLRGVDVGLVD